MALQSGHFSQPGADPTYGGGGRPGMHECGRPRLQPYLGNVRAPGTGAAVGGDPPSASFAADACSTVALLVVQFIVAAVDGEIPCLTTVSGLPHALHLV